MKTLEELTERMRVLNAEKDVDHIKKLHEAFLLMQLNMDPRNKFGGEYERMSKIISVSDVLYWYLITMSKEKFNLGQILRLVDMKLDKIGEGPEIQVMPPEVNNKDNTVEP